MLRKSFSLILLLGFSFALCAFLAGCSCGKVKIGVLETSGDGDSSRIVFFDSNLQRTNEIVIDDEIGMGSLFYDPVIAERIFYAVPQGNATTKDAEKVLAINLDGYQTSEYKIEKPAMNSVAVSTQYVFTCNTLNGVSSVNRCNKATGDVRSVDEENAYISHIVVSGDRLYAFASQLDVDRSWIDEYDLDLNLSSRIDMTEFGSGVYRSCVDGSKLYFTTMVSADGAGGGCLICFDLASKGLSKMEVFENPLGVKELEGKLYVSHGKLVEGSSSAALSVVDLSSGDTSRFSFDHSVDRFVVSDEGLYVLSGRAVYRYSLRGMSLMDEVVLEPVGSDYRFVSGIFLAE